MSEAEIRLIKSKVRKAGENIRNGHATQEDYDIISQWRSVHISVMTAMVNNIRKKLSKHQMQSLILARRLKRLQSIEMKLERFPSMSLDRMQDIAGVRVVFKNMAEVIYFQYLMTKNARKFKLHGVKNYIENPKDDGYRSIHQIFEYANTPKLLLELQIRTQLQHFWATAVEVLGMKTNSKIKQGGGENYHKTFFGLCSALFCVKESTPLPAPYKDLDKRQICDQIYALNEEYKIFKQLSALAISSDAIQDSMRNRYYFVIELDMLEDILRIKDYKKADFDKAEKEYSKLEAQSRLNQGKTDVVLISLDKVKELKSAYPNYYLDCRSFISEVKKELQNKV